jgi:hypothetical protein
MSTPVSGVAAMMAPATSPSLNPCEHVSGVEHGAAFGDGDHGEGVGHAFGEQRGAVHGVDRDVVSGTDPAADFVAVVEHWRFVLLALADGHDAAEGTVPRGNRI